jgi:hypothetical protein
MQNGTPLHLSLKTTPMQKIQLTIPQPCHENWNQMTPQTQGRFCGSCAKTVIDFSAMTDAQLIHYFTNLKQENVCGRMHPDQLDRSIELPAPPQKKWMLYWQYLLAMLLFFFAKMQPGRAQQTVPKTETQPHKKPVQFEEHVILGGLRFNPEPLVTALPNKILIANEDGAAIPFASLSFLPSGINIAADSAGFINISRYAKNKTMIISAIGYEDKSVLLKALESATITLLKKPKDLDEVVVQASGTITCTRTVGEIVSFTTHKTNKLSDTLQNLRSVFNPAIIVYPNPVKKGNSSNFRLNLKQRGNISLSITDANGRLMKRQQYYVNSRVEILTIDIPASWSSGIYIVGIADEKNNMLATQKIRVQ